MDLEKCVQNLIHCLRYSLDNSLTETELEASIINDLQKFLIELRKRISFCKKFKIILDKK